MAKEDGWSEILSATPTPSWIPWSNASTRSSCGARRVLLEPLHRLSDATTPSWPRPRAQAAAELGLGAISRKWTRSQPGVALMPAPTERRWPWPRPGSTAPHATALIVEARTESVVCRTVERARARPGAPSRHVAADLLADPAAPPVLSHSPSWAACSGMRTETGLKHASAPDALATSPMLRKYCPSTPPRRPRLARTVLAQRRWRQKQSSAIRRPRLKQRLASMGPLDTSAPLSKCRYVNLWA